MSGVWNISIFDELHILVSYVSCEFDRLIGEYSAVQAA